MRIVALGLVLSAVLSTPAAAWEPLGSCGAFDFEGDAFGGRQVGSAQPKADWGKMLTSGGWNVGVGKDGVVELKQIQVEATTTDLPFGVTAADTLGAVADKVSRRLVDGQRIAVTRVGGALILHSDNCQTRSGAVLHFEASFRPDGALDRIAVVAAGKSGE